MEVFSINKHMLRASGLIGCLAVALVMCFSFSTNFAKAETVDSSSGSISFVDVNSTSTDIAVEDVVELPISDSESIRVGVSTPNSEVAVSIDSDNLKLSVELTEEVKTPDVSVVEITSLVDEVEAEIEAEKAAAEQAKREAQLRAKSYSETQTQGGLLDITQPDSNYTSRKISITGNDRDILERLVMGEAGNQGFIGAALVAQTIKDLYYYGGFSSIESVRVNCGFSASLKREPNQDVLDAVSYVFDQGGYVVKHRLFYFYSPANMKSGYSKFHESQNYILTYGGHKFFDRWY